MKNSILINPIPKQFVSISNYMMLTISTILIFCIDLKAIPEDWPSTTENEFYVQEQIEVKQLTCIGSIQMSLDSSGVGIITPAMLLIGVFPNYNNFKVVINQTGNNKVDCNDIGKVITATVIDITNGMMCWSSIQVEDKLKPVILCRADTVSCSNEPFTLDYTQFVILSDNCDANVSAFYDLNLELYDCSNYRYTSVAHLKWTATDDYGNVNTCLQDIYFKKSSVDSIVFPPNDTVFCPNPDLTQTGVPTLFGDTVSYLCNLLATHVDDSIVVCGGMIKLRRLWTVIDWCSRAQRSYTQEILVADTTRPEVTCPKDTILFSPYNSCKAKYVIPAFNATDICSPTVFLTKVVRVDSSYLVRPGQLILLDTGKHSLNFIAIDPCGNADTCTSYVWVKDKITPSLICPPALVVSLDPTGHVILTAAQVGARGLVTDNCCIDTILVRRMTPACGNPKDTLFRDKITFCCDDIKDTIMIVLKAVDCSGNVNFCMIQVYVQDKNPVGPPVCPADTTVSCVVDYFDIHVTGGNYVLSSCLDTIQASFVDSLAIDSCKNGDIFRSFYLVYPDGTVDSSCMQVITIYNNYVFHPNHIIWARDTIIPACIPNLPDEIRSIPSDPFDTCGTVFFSFVDIHNRFTADSCEIIDRIWTAYSACSHQTVKDTQIIILVSLNRSKLTAPRDTTVVNGTDSCSRNIKLAAAKITGCSRFAVITNSFNNGGANASGIYPVGLTQVIFTAKDSCGMLKDTTIVIVQDKEAPDITCDSISVDMLPNDSLKFTARALMANYTDNCTSAGNLKIAFSNSNFNDTCRYITCADMQTIPDTFNFTVFVKDSSGNISSCVARVIVSDPNFYCRTALRIGDVNGFIVVRDIAPFKDVEVNLLELNQQVLTNDSGKYIFKDIISNKPYTIIPSFNKNWKEGLTTLDIVKIQRHILGLELLSHPYEWVAADVDNNGVISGADISWIRKLILGKSEMVPGNESWRFIDKKYKFTDPENPLEDRKNYRIGLQGNWQNAEIDFDAIKIGDVSNYHGFSKIEERLRRTDILIEDKEFKKGEMFAIDLLLKNGANLEGMQFSFDLDKSLLELFQVTGYIGSASGRPLNQEEYNYFNGDHLTVSVTPDSGESTHIPSNGKLMGILFRALKNGKVSNCIAPSATFSNEIYPKSDVPLKALFSYKTFDQLEVELDQWTVDPNPFKDHFYISFQSNIDEIGYFRVFDLSGILIETKEIKIIKGSNLISGNGKRWPHAGTYLYHLRIGESVYNGKLIKAE